LPIPAKDHLAPRLVNVPARYLIWPVLSRSCMAAFGWSPRRWWPPFCAAVDFLVAAILGLEVACGVSFHW